MSSYAQGTSVSVARSQAELQELIRRYNATKFGIMNEERRALVIFEVRNRRVAFVLELPDPARFAKRKVRDQLKDCTPEEQQRFWEQACREKWRALVLVTKAKLEAVRSGITTFEDEFAMHFVMPDGRRLRDTLLPKLDEVLANGSLPPLLGLPAPSTQGTEDR